MQIIEQCTVCFLSLWYRIHLVLTVTSFIILSLMSVTVVTKGNTTIYHRLCTCGSCKSSDRILWNFQNVLNTTLFFLFISLTDTQFCFGFLWLFMSCLQEKAAHQSVTETQSITYTLFHSIIIVFHVAIWQHLKSNHYCSNPLLHF